MARDGGWQVAECMLPGLTEAFAETLADRVKASWQALPARCRFLAHC